MKEQQRRPLPAAAREDAASRRVDPVRGKARIKVGKVGHEKPLRNTCSASPGRRDVCFQEIVALE